MGQRWAETCRRNMRLHMVELLDMPIINITLAGVPKYGAVLHGDVEDRSHQTVRLADRGPAARAAEGLGVPSADDREIPGGGAQRNPDRSIATPAQVAQFVETTTPRFRAAVVLAAWCGLRRGEVCALLYRINEETREVIVLRVEHLRDAYRPM